MKNKKIIIGCILGVLVLGAACFGGWKLYQKNAKPVSVVPVEMLNSDWGFDSDGTSGVVSNSLSQTIVQDETRIVSKIYVKQGQKVKIGDKVLTYDMSTKKLDLELKGYDVQEVEFSIKRAEEDLSNLKKGIVTDGYDSMGSNSLGSKTSLLGSIRLRTVDNTEASTTENTTEATTQEATEATTATTEKKTTTTEVPVDASTESTSKKEETTTSEEEESEVYEPTYTAQELSDMISSKEREIKELKLQLKETKLEYDILKKEVEDGTVTAAVEGIVREVNDPESAGTNGDPIVVIVSEDKLYVKGTVDEFSYNRVTVGMMINATSWDTGNSFQATITEISSYPVTGSSYGSGNPNVSYYPFTAVIEGDTSMISAGETVTINFDQTTAADTGSLYIPLSYVRTEDNKSYVYISDEDGKLKKQTVTTGQTFYNTVIEIKEGLTMEDCVAFPYGKDVKEGAKTVVSESDSDIVY